MDEIAARLREMEKDGRLTPAEVLEEARNPESPLHDQFTWDDTEAAEKYRLGQASRLIVRLRVNVTVHSVPVRAPVYVRDPEVAGSFRNIETVRSHEDASRAVIVDEMKRVTNAVRRAKTVAAALGLTEEISQIDALAASIVSRVAEIGDQPRGTA